LPEVNKNVKVVKNEFTLYSAFLGKISEYDPDVFLSHDLY